MIEIDTPKIDNELPVLYTVDDIQKIFQCGRMKAYALVNARGFPTMRVNRRILIPKEKLEKWINTYTGKEFLFDSKYIGK